MRTSPPWRNLPGMHGQTGGGSAGAGGLALQSKIGSKMDSVGKVNCEHIKCFY